MSSLPGVEGDFLTGADAVMLGSPAVGLKRGVGSLCRFALRPLQGLRRLSSDICACMPLTFSCTVL